jgi:D-alanine-D-alanine ligase-like ATP-grasp enzyme
MTSKVTHFGKVGVLYGGHSSEREISLLTGAAIVQA